MEFDATYHEICSAQTVQSEKRGFFNEFCVDVRDACGDKWLRNYFGKLKSNAARVLSIFSDREVCDPVLGVLEHVQPVFKQKDALFSAQRRAQADKLYLMSGSGSGEGEESRELLHQALMAANLAVMRAPDRNADPVIDEGLTLALAYRSRASILIRLGEGEAALSDLKLAINFGLELKSSVDYYLKMAKAYAVMGEPARAEISVKIAEKMPGCDSTHIALCRKEISAVKPKAKEVSAEQVPQLAHGESAELIGASKVVRLVETKDKGRFVVANEGLRAGDVLLCEEPVAACLEPTYFGTHCHH